GLLSVGSVHRHADPDASRWSSTAPAMVCEPDQTARHVLGARSAPRLARAVAGPFSRDLASTSPAGRGDTLLSLLPRAGEGGRRPDACQPDLRPAGKRQLGTFWLEDRQTKRRQRDLDRPGPSMPFDRFRRDTGEGTHIA